MTHTNNQRPHTDTNSHHVLCALFKYDMCLCVAVSVLVCCCSLFFTTSEHCVKRRPKLGQTVPTHLLGNYGPLLINKEKRQWKYYLMASNRIRRFSTELFHLYLYLRNINTQPTVKFIYICMLYIYMYIKACDSFSSLSIKLFASSCCIFFFWFLPPHDIWTTPK